MFWKRKAGIKQHRRDQTTVPTDGATGRASSRDFSYISVFHVNVCRSMLICVRACACVCLCVCMHVPVYVRACACVWCVRCVSVDLHEWLPHGIWYPWERKIDVCSPCAFLCMYSALCCFCTFVHFFASESVFLQMHADECVGVSYRVGVWMIPGHKSAIPNQFHSCKTRQSAPRPCIPSQGNSKQHLRAIVTPKLNLKSRFATKWKCSSHPRC